MVQGMGHDRAHHTRVRSEDERISRDITSMVMHTKGNVFSTHDTQRVGRAIMATQVAFNPGGFIEQTKLRQGDRDTLKFTLANADINGIAMEGHDRMITDAIALFMEMNDYRKAHELAGNLDGLFDFLGGQAFFLRSRLEAMPGDIAHYFPDSEEAVKVALVMADLFKPREFAVKSANFLQDTPAFQEAAKNNIPIGAFEDISLLTSHVSRVILELMAQKEADEASELATV
jgi:hypothetical protein